MTTHWKRNSSLCFLFIITATILIILFIADINHSDYVRKQQIMQSQSPDEMVISEDRNGTGADDIQTENNLNTADYEEEFVVPQKILIQELHPEDLIYESSKYLDHPTINHQYTGQFRDKFSLIWDPYPQYVINSSGLYLHLMLNQDATFLPQNLKMTELWYNDVLHTKENPDEYQQTKGCFYKGTVRNENYSVVTVSLCGGMIGHIITANASFLIHPVEKYSANNTHILHKLRKFSTITENNAHRSKREIVSFTTSNDYTMEVLVAVDSKMEEYHGENMKSYVLILMSIVSSIYLDPTIGNAIKVAVVHILLIHDDVNIKDIQAGVSASILLGRFCRIIQQHMFHYDTALLLTRDQICHNSQDSNCETLGLAELGSICKLSSCAMVQENGLSAAFTIAHELGHILSMPHDDDVKCKRFQSTSNTTQNIMSRMLDHNTHPWSWSKCSKYYVTDYLERGKGHCMRDKPLLDMTENTTKAATFVGEFITPNQQCELVFGRTSIVCPYMPPCGRLWCGNDVDGCRTQHMPWADGSICGEGVWCQRGQCVAINREALLKIDGAWGPWSRFRECSRTCGGGIQSSTRECDSPLPANGGKYCIGNRIKYKSCNTQDCGQIILDFREEQCSALNNHTFGIKGLSGNINWLPKYGLKAVDECKLFCRVENSSNYFLLQEKVKDGTPCSRDSFNKCINGVCWEAGCDHELGSNKKLDKCGVCGGNNQTCVDVYGIISSKQLNARRGNNTFPIYIYATTIPAGSLNLDIVQPGYPHDSIYIALVDDKGIYILNGYNVIAKYNRIFAYAGVAFEYSGTNSEIERLSTSFARQLKRDLTLEIFSRSNVFNSTELLIYKYTVSLNQTHLNNFGSESTSVSTGFAGYAPCHDGNCREAPSDNQYCGENCGIFRYVWNTSDWQKCPASCALDYSTREVECLNITSATSTPVEESYCINRDKPRNKRKCPKRDCNEWITSFLGKCNTDCTRRRSVSCYNTKRNTRVNETNCVSVQKPRDAEDCCSYKWRYSWSACSVTCGFGYRVKRKICIGIHPNRKRKIIVPENKCIGKTEEISPRTKTCRRTCEEPGWVISPWSECSVGCGMGYALREVRCMLSGRNLLKEYYCYKTRKPVKMRRCQNNTTCKWRVGVWKQCNCKEMRKRNVMCFDTQINKLSNGCPANMKPRNRERCVPRRNCAFSFT